MSSNKLYRSRSDAMLAGVAAGLADYLDLDPTLVRLIWVVVTFAGGAGLLIYLVMWLILPLNPDEPDSHRSAKAEEFRDMIIKGAKRLEDEVRNVSEKKPEEGEGFSSEGVHVDESHTGNDSPKVEARDRERRTRSGKVLGFILVIVGVSMVMDTVFRGFNLGEFWPVIIIAIGCYKLFSGFGGGER